jgi:hypothetical protein
MGREKAGHVVGSVGQGRTGNHGELGNRRSCYLRTQCTDDNARNGKQFVDCQLRMRAATPGGTRYTGNSMHVAEFSTAHSVLANKAGTGTVSVECYS